MILFAYINMSQNVKVLPLISLQMLCSVTVPEKTKMSSEFRLISRCIYTLATRVSGSALFAISWQILVIFPNLDNSPVWVAIADFLGVAGIFNLCKRWDGRIDLLSSPDCHIFIAVSENTHIGHIWCHMAIWCHNGQTGIWPYGHFWAKCC